MMIAETMELGMESIQKFLTSDAGEKAVMFAGSCAVSMFVGWIVGYVRGHKRGLIERSASLRGKMRR
mgnify:CR=1 FL=1